MLSTTEAVSYKGNDPYQYYLVKYDDSIRMLRAELTNTSAHDDLRYDLVEVRLSDHPTYEALPYPWAEPLHSERIFISKGYLMITENLAFALKSLQNRSQASLLMVDAVCIDQNNVIEKSV